LSPSLLQLDSNMHRESRFALLIVSLSIGGDRYRKVDLSISDEVNNNKEHVTIIGSMNESWHI
jgi:hypothetical protein